MKVENANSIMKRFLNEKLSDEQIYSKIELQTMLYFQMIQMDCIARELKDLSTQQEKKDLTMYLNMTKRVINSISKKFNIDTDSSDEMIDEVSYNLQEICFETTKRMMNSFRKGTHLQFLESTKFFK